MKKSVSKSWLIAFGIFYFLLNSVLPAEEKSRPLDIQVQRQSFGNAAPADIAAVLISAATEIWRYCHGTQLGGIDVYHRPDHPQTDFKRNGRGRVSIGLATRDNRWAQYSFQFAHEFCHALANYSNGQSPPQSARKALHANLWLEESLCETASLFALRAMNRSWQTAPPYQAWRDYAPWLKAYAEERLALPEHQLPHGKPFPSWFRANQPALRQNSGIRASNTIIAIQLLPLFEAEPRGWKTVTFLNRGPHDANESLAERFVQWRSQCPAGLHPFVVRLAAIFGISL
jgi:hypothetical protein